MSISSLADNIGELRVPDLEKKVNLLSLSPSHLYSDVACSCGRRTHNEWRYRLARLRTQSRARKIAKNAGEMASICVDTQRAGDDVD
jgi:hypothetical protein